MSYAHTQRGGLHWVLGVTAAACLVGAWSAQGVGESLAVGILVAVALLMIGLMLCFFSLTVEDGGDALQVRFGPISLFKRRIAYARIEQSQPGRSKLIDGFGIHWVPGRGWTWNLWGFDCVELLVDGKQVRIGSDDAQGLSAFLNTRISRGGAA